MPFELPLVIIASRALEIATAVRVCVMSLLDTLSRALQGGLGMNQLVLGVGNSLVGISQRFHFSRGKFLRPYRRRSCIRRSSIRGQAGILRLHEGKQKDGGDHDSLLP